MADFRYRDDGVMLVNAIESEIMHFLNMQTVGTDTSNSLSIFIVMKLCSWTQRSTNVLDLNKSESFVKRTETFIYIVPTSQQCAS